MIPTRVFPYTHGTVSGEIRIGWASWDDGSYTDRSIKWAYPDASGKVSRGAPELPFDILIDMVDIAMTEGELTPFLPALSGQLKDLTKATKQELRDEKKALSAIIGRLMLLMRDVPWANWQPVYDKIGAYYEAVKRELASRP